MYFTESTVIACLRDYKRLLFMRTVVAERIARFGIAGVDYWFNVAFGFNNRLIPGVTRVLRDFQQRHVDA